MDLYNIFLDYETYINAVCVAVMFLGMFFVNDEKSNKYEVICGSLIFLGYSTLFLSVFVNICSKGF